MMLGAALLWAAAASAGMGSGLGLGQAVGQARLQLSAHDAADPDLACATCHRAIYDRYRATPMANASGTAAAGFIPAQFFHRPSGVEYRIREADGRVSMSFRRMPAPGESAQQMATQALSGERELRYFIGSGHRGRTYLFEDQGYWFEIPINWYGRKQVWDMAPNYIEAKRMPLTLPVDPGCLHCHATGAASSMPEARNKYVAAPFAAGGVSCASCHGDGSAHAASGGKVAMVDLDRLAAVKRDSVCLSCHLEGQVPVVREGRRLEAFLPGESIFDYASYFVHRAEGGSGGRATSQWEALLQSACKRGSGDRLTCVSCHDPHGSEQAMTAAERVAFDRGRCLQCHDAASSPVASANRPGFARSHHPENRDCVGCHMPRGATNDIAHEQVTDHRIVRVAASKGLAPVTTGPLVRVGATALEGVGDETRESGAEGRDLGLAYAQLAVRGDREAASRAVQLLRQAESRPEAAADHDLHDQLGFLTQLGGDRTGAATEYQKALAADGHDSLAAGNLALLLAQSRQYALAEQWWARSFGEDPTQIRAGLNLATVECGVGEREVALGTLDRVLGFSPDDAEATVRRAEILSGAVTCARPRAAGR